MRYFQSAIMTSLDANIFNQGAMLQFYAHYRYHKLLSLLTPIFLDISKTFQAKVKF